MAAVASPSDHVADMMKNLPLDSQNITAEIPEPTKKGIYGNNETVMYHQGCGFTTLGAYPSLNSKVPTLGKDGQLCGTEQYQYPSPFYQVPIPTGSLCSPDSAIASQSEAPTSAAADKVASSVGTTAGNPNNTVNNGSVNRTSGPRPFNPSNKKSSPVLNVPYNRGGLPTGFPYHGYHGPRFGHDGFQSPIPWLDASMFPNGPPGHAISSGFSSPLNLHPTSPMSGLCQASQGTNLMYPNDRLYGQYGHRAGSGFGYFGGNSWTNGRGWVAVDNKYKTKGRGYGNENMDGLSELSRGPRTKVFKKQTEFGLVPEAFHGRNMQLTENCKEDNLPHMLDKEQYNREDFPEDYSNAKFFVIKSYSEDDVHKSIKYGVWASTPNGNKKLDSAYREAKEISGGCPVFLLFSVNTSGQFIGLAEMMGAVDFNKTMEYWQQEKWIGCFPVKWHIVKDVANGSLRHIILENNDNKPVTNSRDTQEVILEKGIQIIKIFKGHNDKTSILDDFGFYAARERIMLQKRAKQKSQKQVFDRKPSDDFDKVRVSVMGEESAQKSMDSVLKEPVGAEAVEPRKINGELKLLEENASDAVVENSPNNTKSVETSESKVFDNVVASTC